MRARPLPLVLAAATTLILARAAAPVACHVVASSGGPYEAACADPVVIPLDGTGLACDRDPLEFEWSTDCPGATFDDPATEDPVLTLAGPTSCLLECTVTLEVRGPGGGRDRDTGEVRVEDAEPPLLLDPAGVLATLWPPSHGYACFAATDLLAGAVVDACGEATVRIAGCTSGDGDDERGTGDGHTASDCVVDPDGGRLCARAERSAARGQDGRRYVIAVEASDDCGNAVRGPAGVILVPHDRGR